MSVKELFSLFKYPQEAILNIQRAENGKYMFKIGGTLSTMYECDTIEEGISIAIELQKPQKEATDLMETHAEFVRQFAKDHDWQIKCKFTNKVTQELRSDRLIYSVEIEFSGGFPLTTLDPICGWTEAEVEQRAIATFYPVFRLLQLREEESK